MEGKKSFVLYSDQREIFEQLTDEQAGKLIKHIYSYVNDENPSSNDPFVNIPFTLIKLQLKRDLKKWEIQQEQRKLAGKKSAEIRKQALTDVNERSISSTVNGNVNDNVTVINKTYKVIPVKDEEEKHNEIFRNLWSSEIWLEGICMKYKADIESVRSHLNEFRKQLILKGELKESDKKAKEHFINWINKGNEIPKNKLESKLKDNWW